MLNIFKEIKNLIHNLTRKKADYGKWINVDVQKGVHRCRVSQKPRIDRKMCIQVHLPVDLVDKVPKNIIHKIMGVSTGLLHKRNSVRLGFLIDNEGSIKLYLYAREEGDIKFSYLASIKAGQRSPYIVLDLSKEGIYEGYVKRNPHLSAGIYHINEIAKLFYPLFSYIGGHDLALEDSKFSFRMLKL